MKFTGFSGLGLETKQYLYILAKGLQKQQGHLLLFPFIEWEYQVQQRSNWSFCFDDERASHGGYFHSSSLDGWKGPAALNISFYEWL